jgi:hypothetical protein
MAAAHLTVAICTWNRSALLARALDRMTRLVVPDATYWELVVVNNCCSDDTDAVIASFATRLPVRRAFEPNAGLSHARNRAVAESSGDYLMWTDDDELVSTGWLAAYVQAFSRWPDADVFGGPIEPLFEGDPPPWIAEVLPQIGPVFGCQSLGDAPVALTADRIGEGPFGGNFVVRRRALPARPFSPALGVTHGHYAIGEETDVLRRLLAEGRTGWWTPEPLVQHWVPRDSQTLAHVRRWMTAAGRYEAEHAPRGPLRMSLDYVRWLGHEAAFTVTRPFASPATWVRHAACASKARGAIAGRPAAGQGGRA